MLTSYRAQFFPVATNPYDRNGAVLLVAIHVIHITYNNYRIDSHSCAIITHSYM